MNEKTLKQLADSLGKTVADLSGGLKKANLTDKGENDLLTVAEQDALLSALSTAAPKARISLKTKTTSTAKMTGSSGKAKTVQIIMAKKKVFEKPDPAKIEAEAAAQKEAAAAKLAAEKQALIEQENARKESEARQKAALEAMRSKSTISDDKKPTLSVVVKKKKSAESVADGVDDSNVSDDGKSNAQSNVKSAVKKSAVKKVVTPPKVETPEQKSQRLAREAEEERLRQLDLEAKRLAAEEAQKRTLEAMKQMASKYSDSDKEAVIVKKDEPLADGLVGAALEESFEKERREIKRGATGTATRGAGRKGGRRNEEREMKSRGRALKSSQAGQHKFEMPVEKIVHNVEIGETIVVADLAQKMAVKVREVIKSLMKMGEMARESDSIDQTTASLVVEEFGHNIVLVSDTKLEDDLQSLVDEKSSNVQTRPPVVTIMGHVDHGKTSLLDKIRETRVASGEAGGITQHIGAYHVTTDRGVITFLDTPGHAAFSAMRSRGAEATDVVVLVVAADDGMMPQTEEAIDHARAAGVPLIVAINKMDKDSADPDRVLNELTIKEVVSEAWGGDTPVAKVSAKTGDGIDELLELISIQAELLELTAPVDGAAQGVVIESRLDKGRGVVASLLVKKGTLNQGDLVLAGEYYGRVRAMTDESGRRIQSAGPSIPVEILGLPDTPMAGSEFLVVSDEKKAREVADFRLTRERERVLERQNKMRLENLFGSMGQSFETLNLILKTDVRGSLEALLSALNELSTDEVKVRVISSGVGAISESDVILAESSEAVLLGFNVRADAAGKRKADEAGIDIRYYSVIYGLIDDVKAAMSGMLAPEHREQILGVAEVREVFRSSKFGFAAGCMVTEGVIYRNKPIRVLRDDKVVFTGQLQSLRRYKDDVNEVKAGIECGLAVKGYEVMAGDKVEVYEIHEVKREL